MISPPPLLDPLALPMVGCRLIEASAGTGKTFTIALLYLRAVLGHEMPPRMPREILVATFTELAADELKARIHARLIEAAQYFAGERQSSDEFLARLAAYFPASTHSTLVDRLLCAADQMDDAAIYTIHGWCQRMLQEHAFLSGQPFSRSLCPDLTPWFDWAVQDYWRSHIYPLSDDAMARAIDVFRSPEALWATVQRVVEQTTEPIHAGEAVPDFVAQVNTLLAAQSAARSVENAAKMSWQQEGVSVMTAFTRQVAQLNGAKHRTPKAAIQQDDWQAMTAWIEGAELPPAWIALFCAPQMNKGAVAPDTPFQQKLRAWKTCVDDAKTAERIAQRLLHHHAAHWLRQRIADLKTAARVIGFNDLLQALAQALAGTHGELLAKTIAARYPLAMIDEFQDTDALQLSLFDRIFGITQRSAAAESVLVLIGDPKQLIYRFRNADIGSYLSARRAVQGIYTLKDNYRSTPSLVAAVNAVFQFAPPPPTGLFGGGEEIPFVPATAQGAPPRWTLESAEGWVQPKPLRLLSLAYSDAESIPNKAQWQRQMADAVAAQIVATLNASRLGQQGWAIETQTPQTLRPIEPQDITILVADRFEAQVMRRALQRVGVASVYQSDRRNLFVSDQAQDFWHWLNAMAEPTRPDLLKIALVTASCARTLHELDALRDEAIFSSLVERMVSYRALWQRFGILAAVYQWLHDFDIPARLLTDAIGEDSGARRLTNLLHLADWAQSEQQMHPGIEALRHRFANALTASEPEGELRLDQDENLVRIMSIHASKGLQFPWVYLPFLALMGAKSGQRGNRANLEALKVAGRGWVFDFDEEEGADERRAEIDEAVRKAYVALTRAESVCVMGVGLVRTGQERRLSPLDTALGRLWALDEGDPAKEPSVLVRYAEVLAGLRAHDGIDSDECVACGSVPYEPASMPDLAPARTAVARAGRLWRMSSYSQIVSDAGNAVPENSREADWQASEEASGSWLLSPEAVLAPRDAALAAALTQLPRGHVFGSLMHDVLETAGRAGFAATAALLTDESTALAFPAPQMPADGSAGDVSLWRRWLLALLTEPMPLAVPRALSQLTQVRVELEFWLPVDALDIAALDTALRAAVFPGRSRPRLGREHLHGVLKGFMDVVFEADGRYFVLDYKSNALADYAPDVLVEAMLSHRYDVQLVLYLAALHRHLRDRIPDYDPAQHLGGALYWFTRGVAHVGAGQCLVAPPLALLAELDVCWDGQPIEAVH